MYLRIECAVGNSPPGNKNKKRTAHYTSDECLKGQLQNSGLVDSFTHRENNKFYYVVSNKLGFSFVAFCVYSIESLLVSLSVLGRDVWSSWSDLECTTLSVSSCVKDMPFSFRRLLLHFVHKNSFSADVPCFRTFFFAHFWPTLNKIYKGLSRCKKLPSLDFQKKSSFIGQGKNTLSIETVLENLPPLFLIWKSTTVARNSWRNERSKRNYKKLSHWQPSLFILLPAVRRLNTKDSNSQSDKSLLC